MGNCTFDLAWRGPCKATCEGSVCTQHAAVKCCVCGEQSTHECDHAGQLAAGHRRLAHAGLDDDLGGAPRDQYSEDGQQSDAEARLHQGALGPRRVDVDRGDQRTGNQPADVALPADAWHEEPEGKVDGDKPNHAA